MPKDAVRNSKTKQQVPDPPNPTIINTQIPVPTSNLTPHFATQTSLRGNPNPNPATPNFYIDPSQAYIPHYSPPFVPRATETRMHASANHHPSRIGVAQHAYPTHEPTSSAERAAKLGEREGADVGRIGSAGGYVGSVEPWERYGG
jgi:hypothetical protein